VDQFRPERAEPLSPSRRRNCIDHVRSRFHVFERRACLVLGQHRSTQRRVPVGRADSDRLVSDMIELTRQYGRYGYRRIAALLRDAGWQINDKRVERLWRREALKVPMKQPKKGWLWLNDGSCVRLRTEYRDLVLLSHMHACAAGQRDHMTSCTNGRMTGKHSGH